MWGDQVGNKGGFGQWGCKRSLEQKNASTERAPEPELEKWECHPISHHAHQRNLTSEMHFREKTIGEISFGKVLPDPNFKEFLHQASQGPGRHRSPVGSCLTPTGT